MIGGPVYQEPAVLAAFLKGLERLDLAGIEPLWAFVDDVGNPASALLRQWQPPLGEFRIFRPSEGAEQPYQPLSHQWRPALWLRVGELKNHLITVAREAGVDYLFLVDSDLVLQPATLQALVATRKDIVSEVFWTVWESGQPALPNVWVSGHYNLCPILPGETLADEEKARRSGAWLNLLTQPGLYPVGGLGACTLLSRRALAGGISFSRIPTLDYWGEDRHFCVRAQALGFELWAHTGLAPRHLYRPEDLAGLAEGG